MKRLFAILTVWLGVAHAEPTVHFGVGAIAGNETFSVENPGTEARETTALLQGTQFKAGYGDIRSYAVEFDLGYGRYDKNIFSDEDTDYIYFDVSLIKAFDPDLGFYPFFKFGFGTGEMEIRRTVTKSVSSGSFFAGAGLYLPAAFGFDLEASVIYRGKSWEGLEMVGTQVKSTSYVFEPYLGVNYRF